ncbi:MAG: hypothetical protein R6U03_03845 [Gillisia sp.]
MSPQKPTPAPPKEGSLSRRDFILVQSAFTERSFAVGTTMIMELFIFHS